MKTYIIKRQKTHLELISIDAENVAEAFSKIKMGLGRLVEELDLQPVLTTHYREPKE